MKRLALLTSLLLPSLAEPARAGTAPSPKEPPPVVDSAPISLWEFTVTPYGWLSSIDASVAAKGYGAETQVGLDQILDHLDMVAMMNVEARRGRWGGWVDGIYLKVSSDAETPGPLLDSLGVSNKTLMLEAALFYRLWEGPRGHVDLYGGARYSRMEVDLSFHPSESGIQEVAEGLSHKIFDAIETVARDKAEPALAKAKATAIDRAHDALRDALRPRRSDRRTPLGQFREIADAAPRVESAVLRSRRLRQALDTAATARIDRGLADLRVKEAVAEGVSAAVRQKAAAAQAKARKAVEQAEQRLATELEHTLTEAIPDTVSDTYDWIDPFVGMRGRYNFNDSFYAVAKADIGGFGVGSELTWQAYGGLGWQVNRSLSTEIGYRYMDIEYDGGHGAGYNLAMSGVVISASVHF